MRPSSPENRGITRRLLLSLAAVMLLPGGAPALRAQAAPVVDLASANSGGNADRSMCLTVAAGQGAAYECGDLRLAHALPVTRTLNKARGVVLLYSSQHAQPYPIVAANVRLPAGSTVPTSVTAKLFVDNVERASSTWTAWTAGATRRISLGFDAISLPTAIYTARFEVTFVYGGSTQTASATQDLVIVNRSASKYRPGWWPAGLEQIYGGRADGRVLWVGGDGSTRIYTQVSGTAMTAPSLTRPDTLLWRADLNLYQRKLPGGTSVWYGPGGQHIQTSNRIGQTTDFAYNGDLSLASITLPAAGGTRPAYTFAYTGQQLTSVTAPGSRTTSVAYDAATRRITITDPDARGTSFYYNSGDWRMARRVDKRGTSTVYTFTSTRLTQTRLYMAGGTTPDASDPITTFRPAETMGLHGAAAMDTTLVYTKLDGPRPDPVGDTTALWLDGRGAPWKIRDALGATTTIYRTDARFPALPTRTVAPRGTTAAPDSLVSRAWYNARGNVDSVKVINPLGSGQDARTKYVYGDASWPDFPTLVTGPGGETSSTGYDGNGNALWQEDSRGTTSRATFTYYGAGPWHGMPASAKGPLTAPDSIYYDAALGNLSATRSPLGWRTTVLTDAAGRDTLVTSPIDATHTQSVATRYDAMGRDSVTLSSGPAMPYTPSNYVPGAPAVGAEWTLVSKEYDANGGLVAVTTQTQPEVVAAQTSTYTLDRAGRVVDEMVPGKTTHYAYDPAGNVTDVWNARNLHTLSRYDELNRRIRVTTDSVRYAATTCEGHPYPMGYCTYSFPRYPNNPSGGLTIPGDTATYAYDISGAMTAAHNRWARVDRTYYPNGQLQTDTLRIRRWRDTTFVDPQPGDCGPGNICPQSVSVGGLEVMSASVAGDPFPDAQFSYHVYGLGYTYDLSGRLTRLDHPGNLSPTANGHTTYTYNTWGSLNAVDDVRGNHYAFAYDDEGRPTQTTYPGGVVDTRRYDGEGQTTWHRVAGSSFVLSADSMVYDARGKVLQQINLGGSMPEQTTNHYSGLGTLVASEWGSVTYPTLEEYRGDPLGRTSWSRTMNPQTGNSTPTYAYGYHLGSSALQEKNTVDLSAIGQTYSPDTTYSHFDPAGNADRSGTRSYAYNGGNAPTWTGNSAQNSYYSADDRLAVVQRYETAPTDGNSGTYDDYRYDALGRRILVRSRRDGMCDASSTDCESSIQRFVWDGDQMLYEIRTPGASTVSAAQLESDQPTGERYGVVAYTHAGGIDAPLGIIRMGHPQAIAALIVPHANYRGTYHAGTDASGQMVGCPATSSCIHVVWPAPYQGAYYQGKAPRGDWIGSLVTGQQDGTGLMYRRNRYYNPTTGQFTQSDPIGIAGGLNTYGFANGDPIGYSDPNGLCPCGFGQETGLGTPTPAEIRGTFRAVGRYISSLLNPPPLYSTDRNGKRTRVLTSTIPVGGLGIAGEAAAGSLADEALVCRGGTCRAGQFISGAEDADAAGRLAGVSVNSANRATLSQLATMKNGQVGVTTVGEIRAIGGEVVPDAVPNPTNPSHARVNGLTGHELENLFTPTTANPNRP